MSTGGFFRYLVGTLVGLAVPALVFLSVEGTATASQEAEEQELDPRDIVDEATVTLRDAIVAALRSQPGRAVEAELEGEIVNGETTIVFEVMIVSEANELHEVILDPDTGTVLENVREDDAEDFEELVAFRRALRHTELGLEALIASAEELVKGTPVGASLEFDDGGPEADVLFVNGRYLIEAGVEGRAGHVIELELEEAEQDDDDERKSARNEFFDS